MLDVRLHADVHAFLERAGPWLTRTEREHGLLLGVANEVLAGALHYRPPLYWATIEDDAARQPIVGCAFRTPPHHLGVTSLPEAAAEPLVQSLHEVYRSLPGVGGAERAATSVAAAWTERFGGDRYVLHRQRLYSLSAVQWPGAPAAGALRRALPADLPVARAWVAGFIKDTGVRHVTTAAAERLIRDERLYFWVDGEPRCMLGAVRDSPSSTGIAAVYTPPRHRGRGYATTAVAALSRQLLESGRRSCFLYADLANDASNAIYRRIGYEPVADVVDIAIN